MVVVFALGYRPPRHPTLPGALGRGGYNNIHIGTKCPHMVESEHFGILMEVMALVEHSYHSLLYTDGVELISRVTPIPPSDY